jgi:hypothetical protein
MGGVRGRRLLTSAKPNTQGFPVADDPADIFRRMERRSRRPGWTIGVMAGLLAVVATGGVIAYQTVLKPNVAPPAAHALFITPGNGSHP